MNTDEQRKLAAEWLVLPGNDFWTWDAAGEVLLWKDGRTVVFREELILILESLPEATLPPAGFVGLVLAACRGLLPEEEDWPALLPGQCYDPGYQERRAMLSLECMGHLTEIANLPEELRRSPASKAALAGLAVRDFFGTPKAAVVSLLREGLPLAAWPVVPGGSVGGFWTRGVHVLYETFSTLPPGAIENALRTGLEALPEAAEVELPLGERVRQLLAEMGKDAEFSALAALTREIMAALTLPRALQRPDHETTGGFADIGNRGPLHRLLISELAHDDDTLAARVALNEALYLRREPSAQPPPSKLVVVVDAGVRMWGVPRVLATAVALAALGKSQQFAEAMAFRATYGGAVPIRLDTKEGLVAHLEALETHIFLDYALGDLRQRFSRRDGKVDVLLITHPNSLLATSHPFSDWMPGGAFYTATVDREGNFTLLLRTPSAWSPLASARLRVEALFAEPKAGKRLTGRALPAYFYEPESPLLLPCNENFLCVKERAEKPRYVGISEDHELWAWNSTDQGARRLPIERLRGVVCALVQVKYSERFAAVLHAPAERRLTLVSWVGASMEEKSLRRWTIPDFPELPEKVWVKGDIVMLGAQTGIFALSMNAETLLAKFQLPAGCHWIGPRFVLRNAPGRKECLGVIFNGQRISLEPMPQKFLKWPHVPLHIFDPADDGQLVALFSDGRLLDAETGEAVMVVPCKGVVSVGALPDGNRATLKLSTGEQVMVDLKLKRVGRHPDTRILAPTPRRWSVRSKFTHVALTPAGHIRLRAQKGYWVEIRHATNPDRLGLHRLEQGDPLPLARHFSSLEEHPKVGAALSLVEWPSGGRLWLDSRGFIHLQSADPSIPEVSILLAESTSLPAWTSDGLKVGPAYFTGQPDASTARAAAQIETYLQRFVASCR